MRVGEAAEKWEPSWGWGLCLVHLLWKAVRQFLIMAPTESYQSDLWLSALDYACGTRLFFGGLPCTLWDVQQHLDLYPLDRYQEHHLLPTPLLQSEVGLAYIRYP